jgi:hypothetical protein
VLWLAELPQDTNIAGVLRLRHFPTGMNLAKICGAMNRDPGQPNPGCLGSSITFRPSRCVT